MSTASKALEFTTLAPNPYSLGMVAEFVSRFKPFADFGLGASVNAIAYQLHSGSHLIAANTDTMVGYLGWVQTSEDVAMDWLRFGGLLAPSLHGDVQVITILAVVNKEVVRPLLQAARKRAGQRAVFWQRTYDDGRPAAFHSITLHPALPK